MTLITKLKAVQGITFIQTIIKRINLQKEIFILNIEIGLETVIPHDLEINQLSISFRYYDPIL
jgi:hypothetical protein